MDCFRLNSLQLVSSLALLCFPELRWSVHGKLAVRTARETHFDHSLVVDGGSDIHPVPNILACAFPPNPPLAQDSEAIIGCVSGRVCRNGSLERLHWYRGYRYFPYQFSFRHDDNDLNVASAVISKCAKRRNLTSVDYPGTAAAVVRSPTYAPSGAQTFQLHFNYGFGGTPVPDPSDITNRFFLEVRSGKADGSFPTTMLWGGKEDYASYNASKTVLHHAVVTFTSAEPFSLNFIAYHNDNCTKNVRSIILHNVRVLVGRRLTEPSTVATIPTFRLLALPGQDTSAKVPTVTLPGNPGAVKETSVRHSGEPYYWLIIVVLVAVFCMVAVFVAGIIFLQRKWKETTRRRQSIYFLGSRRNTENNPEYLLGNSYRNGTAGHYENPSPSDN